MVSRETEATILRLYYAEKWKPGTIARQIGVHHGVVRRVLAQAGVPPSVLVSRTSIADPYLPLIVETLEKYPTLRSTRLFDMMRARGYPGGPDHFRAIVARYRPRPSAEAFLRLRTLAGEQAQVDWGHFGKIEIGRAQRPLMGFVMVLSYSRQIFLRFFYGSSMACFLRGHVAAFEQFEGVARVLLYDNLRSAVLERVGDAIRFHPTLLDLATHYRFEPRPVAVARGNEKGRVERAIRFIRDRFFAARTFADLGDLNRQAEQWTHSIAAERPWPQERSRSVAEVFAEERNALLALPSDRFAAEEYREVCAGRTPYVRFDLNDYSVPHTMVRRTLAVHATVETVRIIDRDAVVASHPRSWSKGEQIECAEHVAALIEVKRNAREHRGLDRLHHAAPSAAAFFALLADRHYNLGSATRQLTRLLESFGATALEQALCEAIARGSPDPASVAQILDQRRSSLGKPPPINIELPHDPRLANIVVRPHPLASYDEILREQRQEPDPDQRDQQPLQLETETRERNDGENDGENDEETTDQQERERKDDD